MPPRNIKYYKRKKSLFEKREYSDMLFSPSYKTGSTPLNKKIQFSKMRMIYMAVKDDEGYSYDDLVDIEDWIKQKVNDHEEGS